MKKKNLSPIYIEVFYTYDASAATDQKHGFLKFWTLEFENGVKWSWGMAKKWPEKVIQRSFIKEHSFVNRLYILGNVCNFDIKLLNTNTFYKATTN